MHRITASQSGSRAHSAGGGRLILDEVDDSKNMQEMKGTAMKGEAYEGVESPQNYGFTSSNAPADKNKNGEITDGAEGFMSFMGGNRSFPVASVMDDRRHRLKDLVKDAAKGATAMFGLKEWGQQLLNTDNGMFMTGNTEKKMRFQLVENQNGKKQPKQQAGTSGGSSGGAASVLGTFRNAAGRLMFKSKSGVEFEIEEFDVAVGTLAASGNGGSSGGGDQGGEQKGKATGQKTLHKEDSSTYVDMTKDAVHSVRGKGNVKLTDGNTQTYHQDETTSTRCDDGHAHIRKSGMKIWVSKGGCHSTVPITIVDCADDGGGEGHWSSAVAAPGPSVTKEEEKFYIYPPQPSPYDVTSSTPPIEIIDGNVSIEYSAPIALGGTPQSLILNYAAPLILDANQKLTVDPSVLGGGTLTEGNGIDITSNVISVVGTANRISVGAGGVNIATNYVGQASITTLGTIATGTWNGTPIDAAHGGTGATALTGYVKGTGTTPFTAVPTIPSGDVSGLGTMAAQNANSVAITGGTIDGVVLDGGTF
jgi:phage gp45-like